MDSFEYMKSRHKQIYMEYIDNHIANVKKSFLTYGLVLSKNLGCNVSDLGALIVMHDASKYSEAEFEPYRRRFYPMVDAPYDAIGDDDPIFEEAWKHHYTHNPHHPEYWVKDSKTLPMNSLFIAEMLLDWNAMTYTKGGTTWDWFRNHFDKSKLHPDTLSIVENVVNKMENYYNWMEQEKARELRDLEYAFQAL